MGMASRKQLKDGLVELLGRENWSRASVRRLMEADYRLYIIVGYGTRINEVANNVISTVKYPLKSIPASEWEKSMSSAGVRVTNGK